MNKLKRYVIFLIGLFVNSLGVSLITKASLGTSPISSIPYVLSLSFPFTLGNFTIFFSVFLILLQLLILRKNFKLEHVLQIPVSIVFGYFIDLTMLLFTWVNPQNYVPENCVSSDRMSDPWNWCVYGSSGRCRHAARRIICPCDRSDMENQLWYDKDFL